MKKISAVICFLVIWSITTPYYAWSGEASGKKNRGTFSFIFENDLFYGSDRHYTNGIRFIWVPSPDKTAPAWALNLANLIPWFPENGKLRHGYAIGQSMFTPPDIDDPDPPLMERLYAGWLYGTIGIGIETGEQLDQFTITLGIVGPASLAEYTQKAIHKVVMTEKPLGWDTQLRNEPGIVVNYQRSWRGFKSSTIIGNEVDFTPHVGGALGNVFTYANSGLTMRYGKRLPIDYGPPRIQPGITGSGDFSTATGFGWYLFAGIEGRAVARNIFLDGNTFRDSRSVDKKYLVGDLQYGIVLNWRQIRLSYTHVIRTHEFRTQESRDDFGVITLSVKF